MVFYSSDAMRVLTYTGLIDVSHLLLGCALDYWHAIDSYTSRNRDLHQYELSAEDWDAISMVTSWLKSFRSTTTQMLTTKVPMLSATHAIFRMTSRILFVISHWLCLLQSSMALLMCIQSSVITITNMMTHHSIHGWHVGYFIMFIT